MTRVWIYAVVSFYTQAETLETQRGRLLSEAERQGWTVSRIFGDDNDGVSSGKDGPRKLLTKLLDALGSTPKADRPKYVMMTRQDRIGRGRLVDTAVVLRDIYDLGVAIYTLESGVMPLDDPMDELVAMVKQASASQENRNRIDKARQGHARRKARGLHDGHAPYGIHLIDGKPHPQEPQANIVRTLFSMRAEGLGLGSLADYARAHAPPKRQKNGLRSLRWNKATVRAMLRCQTYREIIVPAEQFDTVSRMERHGFYPISTEGVWPLRGAVDCHCGRRLSGRMNHGIRYYTCPEDGYFRADAVERAFLAFLLRLRTHPHLMYSPDEQAGVMAEARMRVHEIRRELSSATNAQARAWEIAELGNIPPEHLKARLAQHDETIRRLNAELSKAEDTLARAAEFSAVTQSILSLLETLPANYPRYEVERQKRLARLIAQGVNGLRLRGESTSRNVAIVCGFDFPQSDDICLQFSPVWGRISAAL